ncbi:hypothetical protein [Streptomyces anandii]|uniref:hypothetical protein n=1 Tax=Streptomyces anandii TaxID=285454 RepID=UPI0019AC5C6F|nr:hypothetical protein [Streptomyces anandii]GGX83233.1 hypothetical protein GCM10010510_30250 [Streptomyces anandii JCM 4720]
MSGPADHGPSAVAPRRGVADPVKTLMHRHRELCERAVDPMEIAAGLEAHGVTDRTAARFRHRDVFSLAEEMYARSSHDDGTPPHPETAGAPRPTPNQVLLSLLPGALCAVAVAGLRLTSGRTRLAVAAAGVLAVALGARAVLRHGPLSQPGHTSPSVSAPGTRACTYWLLAYALLGDGLLAATVAGGPDGLPDGTPAGAWPLTTAPFLALTLACAPAAWTAHLFTARARRGLATSRGLDEFTAFVRPLLLGAFGLFLCALTGLLAASAAALHEPAGYAQALALGALLLLARLLFTHGFTHAPAVALGAAAAVEALALATVLAARLPGCGLLADPVDTLVTARGPGAVQALACAAAALALLVHAIRALTRASAHARPEEQW